MEDISSLTPAELDRYLNSSALPPPDNVIPNFDNPPNRNYVAKVVLPVCLAVTTIAILFRVYAKLFCVKKIEVSDILMLIGFGCYITDIYFGYRLLGNPGFFIHQWDMRWKDVSNMLFPIFVSGSFYFGVVLTIKAAILLEWSRIFVPHGVRDRFFWLCYGVLGTNTVLYIILLFLANFACTPAEKIWNPLFIGGSCHFNIYRFKVATAALNLCSDVIILLLPQHAIWSLQMSTRARAGVFTVFIVGFICCLAAGFRLGAELRYVGSDDITYHSAPVMLWALVEITCMFLVFGIPSLARILPSQLISPLRSIENRLTQRPLSKISSLRSAQWAGSGMIIKHSRGPSSHTFYRKLNNGGGGMLLTTIDSSRNPPLTESMEGLRDEALQQSITAPEAGVIIRTTQFVTREEFGGVDRDLAVYNGYQRQHPWTKDHI